MSPHVLRHPILAASVIAALGTATIAPAAVAATTPKPAPVTQQALGGLLGGVLNSVTAPVVELITPLVGSTGVLPAVLPAQTVAALTTALTSTVDTLVPADVASLLTALSPAQVQQLVADPTAVAPLLTGLLSSVTSMVSTGTSTTDELTSVLGQLTSVLNAGLPTSAAGMTSLTGILDQLTALLTSPTVATLPVVGPLIGSLANLGGLLPDGPAKTGVVGAVSAAGTGLGLTPAQIAQALALLGLGRAVAKAPDATSTPVAMPAKKAAKTVRAKIVSAKVAANRKTVRVKVLCPATATAGCKIRPSVKVGGRAAKITKSATLARGKSRTFTAKVPAAAVTKAKKSGAKVVVRLATTGSTAGAVTKTVTVRRAR